ncbi:MAG: hypothetical protein M1833_001551 [Piccolia ochrophora]|nr:MAG: hypothetical protein M1833_001551 [Piccolia ochrophora]
MGPPKAKPKRGPASTGRPNKSSRLPQNARIQKRPLLRPPIPSFHATSAANPATIYISSGTPFMSAVTRVRKALAAIDKRAMGNVDLLGQGTDKQKLQRASANKGKTEAVVIKAAGRAVEKGAVLGVYFQERKEDYAVEVRLGSVSAVDDIFLEETDKVETELPRDDGGATPKASELEDEDPAFETMDGKAQQEIPETRVRRIPVLEVLVQKWICTSPIASPMKKTWPPRASKLHASLDEKR